MATFTLDIKLLRRNKVIGGRYAVWTSCEIKNNQMGEAPNVNLECEKGGRELRACSRASRLWLLGVFVSDCE